MIRILNGSLGRRLGFNLFAYSVVGLAAILLLLSFVIDQRFSRLEELEIKGHVDRSEAMVRGIRHTAETRVLDWAVWDDTFDYLHTPNSVYETANLNLGAFENIDIAAMAFVRFDGTFRKTIYFDPATSALETKVAGQIEKKIAAPRFIAMMRATKTKSGFMRVGDRVFVIAAGQVFKSDDSGTPEGYLVMGKELKGSDIVQALQLPSRLDTQVLSDGVRINRGTEEISVSRPIKDLQGQSVATIRFSFDRSLQQEGHTLLWVTAGGVAILLLAMISLLNWRLRGMLIKPVAAFQAHVSQISSNGELAHFDDDKRSDELGSLYREFNAMTDELNSLRAKVEAQSFAIGKSDSAIGIMHNVRNAISPVQAILSKLDDRMQLPAEANVRRALAELASGAAPPERHSNLVAFVEAAMTQFRDELAQHRTDIRESLRSVGHVVEAINAAQSSEQPVETLSAVCDLSATIGSSSATVRHNHLAEVAVNFQTQERFRVAMPRVLLAQIVDNILTNSVEAIAAAGRGQGAISIHAARDQEAPERLVQLTIEDDGDGFPPDAALGLFARGESGRKKSHGGIGLHWCANTINALGGSIAISSGGPGLGSTVVLSLPLASPEMDATDDHRIADAA